MRPITPFSEIDEWSPAQALAVYDFCRSMSETLWNRYESGLIEQIIQEDRTHGFEHTSDSDNLELSFDHDPQQ